MEDVPQWDRFGPPGSFVGSLSPLELKNLKLCRGSLLGEMSFGGGSPFSFFLPLSNCFRACDAYSGPYGTWVWICLQILLGVAISTFSEVACKPIEGNDINFFGGCVQAYWGEFQSLGIADIYIYPHGFSHPCHRLSRAGSTT